MPSARQLTTGRTGLQPGPAAHIGPTEPNNYNFYSTEKKLALRRARECTKYALGDTKIKIYASFPNPCKWELGHRLAIPHPQTILLVISLFNSLRRSPHKSE